ncbi:Noc2-domain-containing protein [Epithele typhae]|uniref:Noc2-domain-containing protein n=1 Tax=Epithele typhae TaxID=378194 RepID=UPI002007B267|nr:Noc2-domain-containing protein [Epithele typhae]KAH9922309.1 Noc2-domain-containing protein [Epithele typhae]
MGKKPRQAGKGKGKAAAHDSEQSDEDDEGFKGMSGGSEDEGEGYECFLSIACSGEGAIDEGEDGEEDADSEGIDDNASFADIDDLDEEGAGHLMELSKLAEKDPEFYKYLQENDQELLNFNPNDGPAQDEDEAEYEYAMEEDTTPVLTKEILQRWQKALLDHRSLKALRKLLIAFQDQVLAWRIDRSSVYNKLITTALRYTPIVLEHHSSTQTTKWKTLQKLITSYFLNVLHFVGQVSDNDMLPVPYITGTRKTIKLYLKTCLDYWATAEDTVRISAFLSVRRLAAATDESVMDTVLKNTYMTLLRSCKSTSAHTLPSINLMKNSASELFCVDHTTAYQHAFGYIRQLAIHLRNSMKTKTKEAYKLVYNWQYAHCVDFWSIVIARACDKQTIIDRGGQESELRALIYPLVQTHPQRSLVPFHLQVVRSMLHLTRHTNVYVPLAPYLLPVLTFTLSATSKPKSSTLRLSTSRPTSAPLNIPRLAPVHGSIGFPEVTVPIVLLLRKVVKGAKAAPKGGKGKEAALAKTLVERIEESARWAEQKRKGVAFAPGRMVEVERWEADVAAKPEDTPLGRYVRVQRKAREKRRTLVEKAREGDHEILED